MGGIETQTPCDLHVYIRLLIRRFGVRIPGGPPVNPQVDGLGGPPHHQHATTRPVFVPSRTPSLILALGYAQVIAKAITADLKIRARTLP